MRKSRTYECVDCGQLTTRMRSSVAPKICLECGVTRAVAAATEMQQHSGPAWDRYAVSPGGPYPSADPHER